MATAPVGRLCTMRRRLHGVIVCSSCSPGIRTRASRGSIPSALDKFAASICSARKRCLQGRVEISRIPRESAGTVRSERKQLKGSPIDFSNNVSLSCTYRTHQQGGTFTHKDCIASLNARNPTYNVNDVAITNRWSISRTYCALKRRT